MPLNNSPVFVLDGDSADDVARAMIEGGCQKKPFYIFDMDEASRRMQQMKDLLPRVQIFFAMKANFAEMMLKLAVTQGLGFDCASPGEINKVKRLNVSPRSIVYAVPIKTPEQLLFARESGIQYTTVDSSCELKKLKQYWPEAKLLLRVRVDSDSKYKLGEKFGCDFETQAFALLDEAASFGLKVIGVAFHVGGCCWSAESYETGLQYAKAMFDYEANAGREMKIVDIGGGFIGDKPERLDKVASIINKTLKKLFPDPEVQIISEVGRYVCDSAFTLYCSICSVRQITKGNKAINSVFINDGITGSFRFYEEWQTVKKFKRSNYTADNELKETIIWGPTCDSDDRVMENADIWLPDCSPEDWLVFDHHGAYTFVLQTGFSCLEGPQIRPVISKRLWSQIKDSKVFCQSDFIINPDVSTPLPSTLPKIIKGERFELPLMPKLID